MMREISLIIMLVVGVVCLAGGYFAGNKMKDDNVVEQHIEKALNKTTGVNTDLSPKTPDPDGHGTIAK